MSDTTTKWAIPYIEGGDIGNTIDETDQAKAELLDTLLTPYSAGLHASRPVSTPGSPGKAGRRYVATDTGQEFVDTGTAWKEVGFSVGDLKMSARTAAQEGWLLCNGQLVSRTTYAALFSAIGTAYGAGDGSTNFSLPNLSGRAPIGAGTGAGLTTRALGDYLGEETHVLTTAEMPEHSHPPAGGVAFAQTDAALTVAAGAVTQRVTTNSGATGFTGGDDPHNTMQPSVAVNFFIKT